MSCSMGKNVPLWEKDVPLWEKNGKSAAWLHPNVWLHSLISAARQEGQNCDPVPRHRTSSDGQDVTEGSSAEAFTESVREQQQKAQDGTSSH